MASGDFFRITGWVLTTQFFCFAFYSRLQNNHHESFCRLALYSTGPRGGCRPCAIAICSPLVSQLSLLSLCLVGQDPHRLKHRQRPPALLTPDRSASNALS